MEDRRKGVLNDDEFEAIAARAAQIVEQNLYAAVGKSVISKILYLAGAAIVAVAAWLAGAGKFKIGG